MEIGAFEGCIRSRSVRDYSTLKASMEFFCGMLHCISILMIWEEKEDREVQSEMIIIVVGVQGIDKMKAACVHASLHLHFRPCILCTLQERINVCNGGVAVKRAKLESTFETVELVLMMMRMILCRRVRCIIVGVFCQRFMMIFHTAVLAPFLDAASGWKMQKPAFSSLLKDVSIIKMPVFP